MKVLFSDPVRIEAQDSADYLDLECEGLGQVFEQNAQRVADLISRYPEAGAQERPGIHRILLHKFPYKLIYSIEGDTILILAVAHQHREPNYWVDRQSK